MGCSSVREVIAVDGGEDDIAEPPAAESFSGFFRLKGVEGGRAAGGLDGAEAASAGAGVTHEHYCSGGGGFRRATPAGGDVWAAGLLTNCHACKIFLLVQV